MSDKFKKTSDEIIHGYRNIIFARYDFDNLKKHPDFPETFSREKAIMLRDYFLNYLYPTPAKRDELNDAFLHLDGFIKQPEKLLRLIIDSASLIFKFGRHLPGIFKAGLGALRSFRAANKFENALINNAIAEDMEPPLTQKKIESLIKSLSRDEIDDFMDSTHNLFGTLHNRELVKKIREVMNHLIKRMQKYPETYSPAEIKGVEMGQEIINQGDLLFDQLSNSEQKQIFTFINKMEREVIDQIFSNNNA